MANQNGRPSAGCAAGPSPRAQTVSLKMLDVSFIAAPLLAPAQHHGVEALRDLDQASPGLRMRQFERMAQRIGGNNAARLHQQLGGAETASTVLVIDHLQPPLVRGNRFPATPDRIGATDQPPPPGKPT